MEERGSGWGALLGVLSGVGITLGTLLPWGRLEVNYPMPADGGYLDLSNIFSQGEGFTENVTGILANALVLLFGIAVAVIAILVWTGMGRRRGGGLLGLGALFAGAGALIWLLTAEDDPMWGSFGMGGGANLTLRYGVWIVLLAAVAGLVSSILLIADATPAAQEPEDMPT